MARSIRGGFAWQPVSTLLLAVAGLAASGAFASSTYTSNLTSRTGYTQFSNNYGCNACHNGAPVLNSYGSAFKDAAVARGSLFVSSYRDLAVADIAGADTDGDGFKNDTEILNNTALVLYSPSNAASSPTAAVALSTGLNAGAGTASSTVSYSVTVTNNGNIPDSFTLGVAVQSGQSWTPTIQGTANNVAAGGTASITVNVAIPGGASGAQFSVARVTAVSQNKGTVSATPLDLTTTLQSSGPRYVNVATGSNTSDCRTQGSPCKTITYAMAQAASGSPGDTIHVAPGTYNPGAGESFPIAIKSGVILTATGGPWVTTVDGEFTARLFTSADANFYTAIDGFYLKRGFHQPAADGSSIAGGAALYITGIGNQLSVHRNVFDMNEARGYAGTASYAGGGDAYGGAIYAPSGAPLIRSNLFYGNIARGGQGRSDIAGAEGGSGLGGGVYLVGSGKVINNHFVANHGIGGNGGASSGPYSGGFGGAGCCGGAYMSGYDVINNIFAQNTATGGTGGTGTPAGGNGVGTYGALQYIAAGTSNVANLFWANVQDGVTQTGSGANVNGVSALIADPLFIDSRLHIPYSSPARGSGTGSPTEPWYPSVDLDGVLRVSPMSRGAYEPLAPDLTPMDFNGDAKSDILYRNTTTGQVYRMLMNGMARSSEGMVYHEPNTAWSIIAEGDFNGDLSSDLLWRNSSGGQVYMQFFNASGAVSGGQFIYTEPNAAWKIIHTPDLNGDGKADILWWNSSTGQVYGMIMNGGTITQQGLIYADPNTNWRIEAVGDFDGDGKVNTLFYRNIATGQTYLMTVTVSGGGFSQTGTFFEQSILPYRVIAVADFNGDGKHDVLWRKDDTGQVYLMLMNGSSATQQGQIYHEPNTAWKIVAVGDYNGDGKADILWRHDVNGGVYMMLMNGMTRSSEGFVYTEPNTAWKILGQWEFRVP